MLHTFVFTEEHEFDIILYSCIFEPEKVGSDTASAL